MPGISSDPAATRRDPRAVLLVFGLIGAAYVAWRIYAVAGVRPLYGFDGWDFVARARESLTTILWGGARATTVPIFYKVLRYDINAILAFQVAFSMFAWLFLATSIRLHLRSRIAQVTGFSFILLFSVSQQITHWDTAVRSESISLSLMVITLASLISFVRIPSYQWAIVTGVSLALWSVARDTNAAMTLFITALLALSLLLRSTPRQARVIVAIAAVAVVYSFASAEIAGRTNIYPINLFVERVLPYPDLVAWYEKDGMPVSDAVFAALKEYEDARDAGVNKIGRFFESDLKDWSGWVIANGRNAYLKYQVLHPYSAFIAPYDNIWDERLISSRHEGYAGPEFKSKMPRSVEGFIYPLCGQGTCLPYTTPLIGLFWLALIGFVLFVGFRYRPLGIWLIPAVFILLTYPHGLLVWHGDALEIERHAAQVGVEVRLGVYILVVLAFDRVLTARAVSPAGTGVGVAPAGTGLRTNV